MMRKNPILPGDTVFVAGTFKNLSGDIISPESPVVTVYSGPASVLATIEVTDSHKNLDPEIKSEDGLPWQYLVPYKVPKDFIGDKVTLELTGKVDGLDQTNRESWPVIWSRD